MDSHEPRYTGLDFYIGYPGDYRQFLQDREFNRTHRVALDEQTDKLLYGGRAATAEQGSRIELVRDAVAELGSVARSSNERLADIRDDLSDLSFATEQGLARLDTTFRWGVNEIVVGIGVLATSLDDLKRIARTPSQNWAFEQYEIARDELHRGLFREALNSVSRAINGFGNTPGYQSDYRLHYFLGVLRLGSKENTDPAVVDPAKAEEAYVLAARYARGQDIEFMAWLSAGRAALVLRALDRAVDHTKKSLGLNSNFGQAHFQMAKILFGQERSDEGIKYLRTAVLLDNTFADEAAIDGDFLSAPNAMRECFLRLQHDTRTCTRGVIELYEAALIKLDGYNLGSWNIVEVGKVEIEILRTMLAECRKSLGSEFLKDNLSLPSKVIEWYVVFIKKLNVIRIRVINENIKAYELDKIQLMETIKKNYEIINTIMKIESLPYINEKYDGIVAGTVVATLIFPAIGIFACVLSGIPFSYFFSDYFYKMQLLSYPSVAIWLFFPTKAGIYFINKRSLKIEKNRYIESILSIKNQISVLKIEIDRINQGITDAIDVLMSQKFLKKPNCLITRDV